MSLRKLKIHGLQALLSLLMAATAATAITLPSATAAADPAASTVRIDVDIIIANNDGNGVDSALSAHAGRLRAQFGQFDSFSSLFSRSFELEMDETHSIAIPGVGSMGLAFRGEESGRYKLDVDVPGGGTTVESPNGGIFFIGGPRAPGGGTIILLIRTR